MTNGEYGMTRGGWPDASPVIVGPFVPPSSLPLAAPSVGHFSFPLIEDEGPVQARPTVRPPIAMWPDTTQAKLAYEEMASEVLRQWQPSAIKGRLAKHAVLAFTSPGDGDGKTGLMLGLAPCLAEHVPGGILVVDVDLRHSDLTAHLSIEQSEVDPAGTIYPTNYRHLNVLPASRKPGPRKFAPTRIETLRDAWPLTLLDMPSLVHAHAVSLASHCDGVYLVARLGYTRRRSIVEAANVLRKAGGRLLGCLVIQ